MCLPDCIPSCGAWEANSTIPCGEYPRWATRYVIPDRLPMHHEDDPQSVSLASVTSASINSRSSDR
jgi:hypothetical protein